MIKIFNKNLENIYYNYMNFRNKINISFEMFPYSNSVSKNKFYKSFFKLSKLDPRFFSITCNQNSGGNYNTLNLIKNMKNYNKKYIVPHFTCIEHCKNEIKDIANNYWKIGVRKILALRGDNFSNNSKNVFFNASDLVNQLKKIRNFEILVAAYPEKHPESKNEKEDLYNLKKKIDNGANKAITQFFFKTESFLNFRDKCFKIGITKEIVPGILPIYNLSQLKKFTNITNVSVPDWIYNVFNNIDHSSNYHKIISSIILINVVNKLFLEGVRSFHFYTLNRSDIIFSISYLLNIKKIDFSRFV
ncbi:methylenetetrahydrofolate reductase [Buchnera aphidicola]|uniref:methylenetetrahydrofolate reductase n=1 Tax=Buchnera aphidicola TaxID=9 RepID=UPI0031B8AEE7